MPAPIDHREVIIAALKDFDSRPVAVAAKRLFAALGYQSDRHISITSAKQFCAQLDPGGKLTDRERETLNQLTSLHLLFQLTDAELDDHHGDLLDDSTAIQTTKIESYLFFAAELPPGQYTRTAFSTLVRAINKPLPMPALVLFRHGDTLSIGIIHRRLHKRDQAKDVLEKVTLIKDIAFADPIRAHVEILHDFALAQLVADYGVANFVALHEAWQKRLGSYALSNDFYREIADWYFWAHHQVEDGTIRLPQHCDTEQEKSLFLIRLLTRVIFTWFLVEKRLIPTDLFREHRLKALLKDFTPARDLEKPDAAPTYYHAVLQNLFFGTLNMPTDQRGFREKAKKTGDYDKNFGVTNLWRHESAFRAPADWTQLATHVPFLNGGLFDCLDDKSGKKQDNFILDGFSDNPKLACHLPNDLFFGPERTVDLSRDYGEEDKRTARSKKAKVRGLIEILSRYKFTIEENTPLEEEIALDPELLGKVFENLLASYNEDTSTTARKALGAFYTPREIVSYMVDEALKSYLATQVPRCKGALDDLFSNKATLKEIKPDTRDALIAAIGRVKILDPACGSGAFPMGALHRLVDLLQKLDPNNESWKRDRLAEARRYRALLASSAANLEWAIDFLVQGHVKAAAVHVRSKFEEVLKWACHALGIAVKYHPDPRKVSASDFWSAVSSSTYDNIPPVASTRDASGKFKWWQPKPDTQPVVPTELKERITHALSWVLNPLSQAFIVQLGPRVISLVTKTGLYPGWPAIRTELEWLLGQLQVFVGDRAFIASLRRGQSIYRVFIGDRASIIWPIGISGVTNSCSVPAEEKSGQGNGLSSNMAMVEAGGFEVQCASATTPSQSASLLPLGVLPLPIPGRGLPVRLWGRRTRAVRPLPP